MVMSTSASNMPGKVCAIVKWETSTWGKEEGREREKKGAVSNSGKW